MHLTEVNCFDTLQIADLEHVHPTSHPPAQVQPRYRSADTAASAPSPTAVATCLSCVVRQPPAAKTSYRCCKSLIGQDEPGVILLGINKFGVRNQTHIHKHAADRESGALFCHDVPKYHPFDSILPGDLFDD